MERLTTDKPISEMNMVELAHNNCFAIMGEAYYRDFECEISARDLVRNLAWELADIELPRDDEDFDEEMMEYLQYDILQTNIGLIALFYRNLWAMADLREQLKRYEDLGTVEELQQAMEKQIPKIPDVEGDGYSDGKLVYDTWICPCCNEHYEIDYDEYEYCPKCGQHIDRSQLK